MAKSVQKDKKVIKKDTTKKKNSIKNNTLKGKSGQPTKLTPEFQKRICKLIAEGNSFKDSCLICNINITTFCLWRKLGRQQTEGIYLEFFKSIKKAEAKFIQHHIDNISTAAKKQWQASSWLLERKYPKQYGRYYHVEQTVIKQKKKTRSQKELENLSTEEILKQVDTLEKAKNVID